jgi:phosphoglycerate dehydrogenase-like enzyme
MLILVADAFDKQFPKTIAKHGEVTDDAKRAPEADFILVRSKTKADKDYLAKCKNLKLIIRGGVGMDNIDQVYCKEHNIKAMNTADASTVAVAELAFAMMIAMPNNITAADKSMREGRWLKKELERTELYGKTLGILGLGRIGLALAARAQAFRMRVLGWHPDVAFTDYAEIMATLEETVAQSDYVSLHMPAVEGTKGVINKNTLAKFKDGAFLINTARGKLIVEEDVVAALKSGKLRGYATDVWLSDPPEKSLLMDAPNTLFLPHIGASTKENMSRIGIMADRLIGEWIATHK